MYLCELMKVFRKIILGIICLLVILPAVGLAVLQIPSIQTKICNAFTEKVSKNINGNISFSELYYSFFDSIIVKDALLQDNAQDTLAYIGKLSINLRPFKALKGNIIVRKLELSDAIVNIDVDADHKMNISGIFPPAEQKDSTKASLLDRFDNVLVNIKSVKTNNMAINVVKNFPLPPQMELEPGKHTIDWHNMQLNNINIDISNINFNLNEKSAKAKIKNISLEESKGLRIEKFQFDAVLDSSGVHVEDIIYKDNYSDIHLDYAHALFSSFDAFSDFLNKVELDCSIDDAIVDLSTLGLYLPGIDNITLKMKVNGKAKGYVSNFTVDSFSVAAAQNTLLNLSGHLSGLPLSNETMVSLDLKKCSFNTSGLEDIIASVSGQGFKKGTVSKLAPGQDFNFKGSLNGFFEDFVAYGGLYSDIGQVNVDIICRNIKDLGYEIDGYMHTDEFDLGEFLPNESLGLLSCNGSVNGIAAINPDDTRLDINSINITSFIFNDYEYKDITATGLYSREGITANLKSIDPNLNLNLDAVVGRPLADGSKMFNIDLSLANANLTALKLDKRDISKLSFSLSTDFIQNPDNTINGDLTIKNLTCIGQNGTHNIGNIYFHNKAVDGQHSASVESSFINGQFSGSQPITTFINDVQYVLIKNKLDNILRGKASDLKFSNGNYKLDITTADMRPLLAYLMPEIHIEEGTQIHFDSDQNKNSYFNLSSKLLSYQSNYINDLNIDLKGNETQLSTEITTSLARFGNLEAEGNYIEAQIDGNCIDFSLNYNKSDNRPNKGQLKALVAFPDTSSSDYTMLVNLYESGFAINGDKWTIEPASIYMGDKKIAIHQFRIDCEDQYLVVDGLLTKNSEDECNIEMRNFDASILNPFLSDSLSIKGSITGDAKASAVLGDILIDSDIAADSIYLADNLLGDLDILANWENTDEKLDFSLLNTLAEKKIIDISGTFFPDKKEVEADVHIDSLRANLAGPFLSTIMTDLTGSLSLDAKVSGPIDKLEINSSKGYLNEFAGTLDFTKVRYGITGSFNVSPKGIIFQNASITDGVRGVGTVNGGLRFDHFENMMIDVAIWVKDMIALNTSNEDNSSFYGKTTADGDISINGPTNDITLTIDATTSAASSINVPLGGAVTNRQSILTFINDYRPILSSYDSLLLHNSKKMKDIEPSNFTVKLKLNTTNNTEVILDIDKNSGNILKAKGAGLINITVNNDLFDIRGNYGIEEGSFRYNLLGLVTKSFSIDEGSTINFTGDIMQSELDLTANYTTKASLSPLLTDSLLSTSRKNIHCLLGITGKLSNPELGFDIKVDDVEPSIQARIEPAFMTEDKRMKQFVALLLTGNFLPDEQSGINNNTSTINMLNMGEMMANQINGVLEQLNIPVDLGLNYQSNNSGNDVFDVAVSTQLFNNRMTINGNIGNKQYQRSEKNDVMGNLDVEIKLGKNGRTKLTMFSHSADEFSSYLDQTQRNGVGIAFSKDFNNFNELWQDNQQKPQRRERGNKKRQK